MLLSGTFKEAENSLNKAFHSPNIKSQFTIHHLFLKYHENTYDDDFTSLLHMNATNSIPSTNPVTEVNSAPPPKLALGVG